MNTTEKILKKKGYSEKDIKKFNQKLKRDLNKLHKENVNYLIQEYLV